MILIVSYDITSLKRRNRIHKLLMGYGENVQDSLFECDIDCRLESGLIQKIMKIINPAEDDVRIYRLCSSCNKKAVMLGKAEFSRVDMVIVP